MMIDTTEGIGRSAVDCLPSMHEPEEAMTSSWNSSEHGERRRARGLPRQSPSQVTYAPGDSLTDTAGGDVGPSCPLGVVPPMRDVQMGCWWYRQEQGECFPWPIHAASSCCTGYIPAAGKGRKSCVVYRSLANHTLRYAWETRDDQAGG